MCIRDRSRSRRNFLLRVIHLQTTNIHHILQICFCFPKKGRVRHGYLPWITMETIDTWNFLAVHVVSCWEINDSSLCPNNIITYKCKQVQTLLILVQLSSCCVQRINMGDGRDHRIVCETILFFGKVRAWTVSVRWRNLSKGMCLWLHHCLSIRRCTNSEK